MGSLFDNGQEVHELGGRYLSQLLCPFAIHFRLPFEILHLLAFCEIQLVS